MNRPVYTKRPIARCKSLARVLSLSPRRLERLSAQAESYYFPHDPELKADGTYREIYSVAGELEQVQARIKELILDNVQFPYYLQGSIKDKDSPRDYIVDARLHAESDIVIKMDIGRFFPSTSATIIFSIWKHFFNTPDDIATTLTKLTTYKGFLPTGASTSPGLANLVFFDKEPELEAELQQQGFIYSRYVDDVNISTDRFVTKSALEHVFTRVFGMFASKDLLPNRDKIGISTRGSPLQVHRLNVNAGRPTLPKRERSRIRAAVKRVQMMRIMHPNEAEKYLDRLKAIQPT
jgi:hypothetical protein